MHRDHRSGNAERWLGPEGGTVILKAPPGGGIVLLTAYSHPSQPAAVPTIEIRRLDRPRPAGTPLRAIGPAADPQEIQTEIVLHIERLGDRRFAGRDWVGNRGKKLRIEAFSIRPLDTLAARRHRVQGAGPEPPTKRLGSATASSAARGRNGLPLTGFAVRLAAAPPNGSTSSMRALSSRAAIVGPNRNGELCIPPIAEDPLEAIKVRVIRRPVSIGASLPKIVLNVGCGYPLRQKLHPHFRGPEWREVRLDLDPSVQPDIVCSITDMRPVETAASADAVWSSHNLEHLQRHEVPLALGRVPAGAEAAWPPVDDVARSAAGGAARRRGSAGRPGLHHRRAARSLHST